MACDVRAREESKVSPRKWTVAVFSVLTSLALEGPVRAQGAPDLQIDTVRRIYFGSGADGPQGQQGNPNAMKIQLLANWSHRWRPVDDEFLTTWGGAVLLREGKVRLDSRT
jgi:hypothetical protein